MANEESDEEKAQREQAAKENLDRWEARLKTGEPVMTFVIDEPFDIGATPEGGLLLKFVWGQIGNFQQAAMGLAVLTPGAARRLKATLPMIQNILDTLPPAHDKQPKN
jgi:hypothetical protein